MVEVEVNSEHLKKPKNARRNIDSRVTSMDGDKYPKQRAGMHQTKRSVVRGKHLGWNRGSSLCRPLSSMWMWG